MEEIVSRLKDIKKDELNEREFFEQVLSVLHDIKDVEQTSENVELLQTTLREIGCVEYEEWKRQKIEEHEFVDRSDWNMEQKTEHAEISLPANIISEYLTSDANSQYGLAFLEDRNFGDEWIKRSRLLYREPYKDKTILLENGLYNFDEAVERITKVKEAMGKDVEIYFQEKILSTRYGENIDEIKEKFEKAPIVAEPSLMEDINGYYDYEKSLECNEIGFYENLLKSERTPKIAKKEENHQSRRNRDEVSEIKVDSVPEKSEENRDEAILEEKLKVTETEIQEPINLNESQEVKIEPNDEVISPIDDKLTNSVESDIKPIATKQREGKFNQFLKNLKEKIMGKDKKRDERNEEKY